MIQKWHLENAKMNVYVTTEDGHITEATPTFAERCTGSTLEALLTIMRERGPVTVVEVV
jgi:hypothetical protein